MKHPEITWSLMHPTPLDPDYVKKLVDIVATRHRKLKKSISLEMLRKSWPENWEEQKKYFGLI